ncbi:MAG: UDP-N-acetylmuramoyl-L-alanyl-D-glutamate--2,6-diaminopimelate ligase [Candidatus Melainabacteria bacterium RIFCSPLOWO2_02_FULL_35_15]|nr:MAG: UDP-N-acetylmuramoyl-L-alanyl-D-glutamate--2,6-diaminopimelate ligase [Candidatus Melainabacteria bacterium RIFCSPLOWO2_12_FULL_35_11]OGI14584.1 MAG: UDP-N-acetylmuramoyl-L-alanyl-D-glutamate--2,6-diaminopimelate ligase [Candidatus Melainabacteria bacterium RIFCSPLOWO2_02_FULL_35_15]
MKYQLTIKKISDLFGCNIEDNSVITGISYDSRKVKESDIFICLIGEKTDGHNYIKKAEAKGAKVILAQKKVNSNLPVIYVQNTQSSIAKLANLFYKEPSKKIKIIGVTGTNGKTTTTHLVQHIFEKNNLKTAVIGTLGTRENINSNYYDAKHTTPQASDLQKQLSNLVEKDFSHLAMEVSSHALSLHRADECNFVSAVLTNITQDHLDFHLTMNEYWRAKRKLFEMLNLSFWKNKYAIINKDDVLFEEFARVLNKDIKLFSYGVKNKSDFQAKDISFQPGGLSFTLSSPKREHKVKSRLNGMFNVYNLLAAISVSYGEGIEINKIIDAVSDAKEVPGRFQIIQNEDSPLCIVDYAHTPDGLENILTAARLMTPRDRKLICVFGCGGDRDPTKRPKMGKIAEDLSDIVIVTSDNPRSEDPKQIISDILSGIKNTSNIIVETDRKAAIETAVKKANKNDVIVIAGKGHEDYQILKDKTIHFDDREVVMKLLQALTC